MCSYSFILHSSVGEIDAISWDGTEVLSEEVLDVVITVVSNIESVWLGGMVIWGMGVSSVGVAVVVDDRISWVVLELELFVIVSVAVGELVGVLHVLDEQVHVIHVKWIVGHVAQLDESNLSSCVSATAEAEVLNNLVLWISSIQDFLIVSLITVAKVVRGLVVVLGLDLKRDGSIGLHEDVALIGEDSSNLLRLLQANSRGKANKSSNCEFHF